MQYLAISKISSLNRQCLQMSIKYYILFRHVDFAIRFTFHREFQRSTSSLFLYLVINCAITHPCKVNFGKQDPPSLRSRQELLSVSNGANFKPAE